MINLYIMKGLYKKKTTTAIVCTPFISEIVLSRHVFIHIFISMTDGLLLAVENIILYTQMSLFSCSSLELFPSTPDKSHHVYHVFVMVLNVGSSLQMSGDQLDCV